MTVWDVGRGLAYEVRPIPTLAALLAGAAGAAVAPGPLAVGVPLLLVLATTALSLYVAHAVDSRVDYHDRHEEKYRYMGWFEDSGGLVGPRGLTAAAWGATLLHLVGVGALITLGEPVLAVIALVGLGLGWGHSLVFDMRWWTGSLDYPLGVTLTFLGAHLAAGGGLTTTAAWVAATFFAYLVGAKVVSDLIDEDDDRRQGKRTLPVVLGGDRAKGLGYAVCVAAVATALGLVATGVVPHAVGWGLAGTVVLLVASWPLAPATGVLVLVGGGYVYVAAVLAGAGA